MTCGFIRYNIYTFKQSRVSIMNKYDGLLEYSGFHNISSHCRIRIYKVNNKSIVILSEMENTGTSITNVIEKIVPLLIKNYDIPYEQLTLVEHYPIDMGIVADRDTFQFVTFSQENNCYANPGWDDVNKKELEELIGEKLDD